MRRGWIGMVASRAPGRDQRDHEGAEEAGNNVRVGDDVLARCWKESGGECQVK
jgi:hypothetical protein